MNTKVCRKCSNVYPLEGFSLQKGSRDGYRNTCKSCARNYGTTYYNSNRDKVKDNVKSYRRDNLIKVNTIKKTGTLKRKYNLTLDQAKEIYSRGCEICGSTEKLCIDHCHKTGKVRGCLCLTCNMGLGLFKDSPDLLNYALSYISTAL